MELAKTLIRSVARSFYGPEHILILDAVLLHSTLRDDELAFVMGSQTKHVRRLCYKLREDGLLHMHSQQEIRQGANRSSSRDYYYVNYHLAIDNIKWRLKSMQREIMKRHGQTEDEKKDYLCPQCKSEFTQMEVLDTADWDGNFTCKRCSHVLQMRKQDEDTAGNEKVSRLNAQLAVFEDLMRQIDSTKIPENDWQDADAAKRPVERENEANAVAKSERVMPKVASTTHGLKMEQDQLQVSVQDSKDSQDLATAQREERIRKLGDNALPVWIAESTVTGEQTLLGREEREARERRERELGHLPQGSMDEETKKTIKDVEESDHMKAYRAAMMEAQEQEAKDEDDDDDDDEDEDDADDEFEIVSFEDSQATKKARIEEPAIVDGQTSVSTAANDAKADVGELRTKPALVTNDKAATNGTVKESEDEDSDEDDEEFEDVM